MAQPFVRTITSGHAVRLSSSRVRRCALLALSATALAAPTAAFAQCTASGNTVTCSGTDSPYSGTSSSANPVTVDITSGASMAAPLVIGGTNGTLNNAGTITGSGGYAVVQYGDNSTITNTGTISSTGALAGSAGISVGDNSVVTNSGALTATAGFPAVEFGLNGSYYQTKSATAATTGNIVFGSPNLYDTGSQTGYFSNADVTYGLTGNVIAYGNLTLENAGIWTGNLTQLDRSSSTSVTMDNAAAGTFTGVLSVAGGVTLTNEGTMFLYTGSALNSNFDALPTSFTNSGTVTVGTTTSPALVSVYGGFTQSAAGTINFAISPAGTATNAAGTTYSQLYAAGSAGNVSLSGTIGLNVAPGFYASNSVYNVILADGTITLPSGSVAVTGATLPFVTFCPTGNVAGSSCSSDTNVTSVTTVGAQQAIQFTAQHTTDYAASLTSALAAAGLAPANANELAVARGLNPLITIANTAPSSFEAGFLGYVDVLSSANATAFLDSASPEGYYAYAEALRDQANAFSRAIDLRLQDQNSNHDEDGWWLSGQAQMEFGSATGYNSKAKLFGFTGGYDFSGPHHVYGLAFNISWDSLNYAPGTLSGHNRDIGVAAYTGWNLGPLHLTGQVAYNFGHLSANKTLDFNADAYTFTNTSSAAEHLLKATGTVGFDLKSGSILLEPFVGIDYMNGKVNGFTEVSTLSSAAALTVDPINADRTDLLAGVSLTRSRGSFRPYLRVAYRDRISGTNSDVSAYFDGQSNSTFTVVANPQAKGEIDGDAGINWVFDDAGSLFIGYQDVIRTGYHSHGINLGIRIEF